MKVKPIEILLVEDSPSDKFLTTEALQQARVLNNLHTVDDGIEALAFLRRQGTYIDAPRPDLILLDLNLPRMVGREVLREVKSDPRLKLIPVVILTTSEAEEDVIRAYGHHANCYIPKPVDFRRFAEVVRTIESFWFSVVALPPAPAATLPPAACLSRPPAESERLLRALHVEDSGSDALLLQDAFTQVTAAKFVLTQVERLADALTQLRENRFDVILTDLGLPDSSGLETFFALQEAANGVPIIVLTSLEDEFPGIQAVQAGAQDYLVKSQVTGGALVRAVRYAIERKRLKEQLLQAQRLEAVGQLAGGIAHDFNNLLTVIGCHSALLLHSEHTNPDGMESARQIAEAVERAANLTRQLLAFSRRQAMQVVSVDLNDAVRNLTKMLGRILGANIGLQLQLGSTIPKISADLGMIEQIIMNLVINSRDAMPNGGKLSFQTGVVVLDDQAAAREPDASPGHFVCLSVADTGGGIPPEVLPRIFEPFFTTKEVGKGTGLGLATVYGIVRQHRGWIKVLSEPAMGTTFHIHFPIPPAAASPAVDPVRPPPAQRAVETILVAEDEAALRELVRRVLERQGFQVLEAASGAEALEVWRQNRDHIDLLFTDMIMPGGMSGRELVDAVRLDRPGLKVIYTSGYSPDLFRQDTVLKAGQNFLSKPYHIHELIEIVRGCLDRVPAKSLLPD